MKRMARSRWPILYLAAHAVAQRFLVACLAREQRVLGLQVLAVAAADVEEAFGKGAVQLDEAARNRLEEPAGSTGWSIATGAHKTMTVPQPISPRDIRKELKSILASRERRMTILKEEMRRLDSIIIKVADEVRVPAGSALAVDRGLFAQRITEEIIRHLRDQVARGARLRAGHGVDARSLGLGHRERAGLEELHDAERAAGGHQRLGDLADGRAHLVGRGCHTAYCLRDLLGRGGDQTRLRAGLFSSDTDLPVDDAQLAGGSGQFLRAASDGLDRGPDPLEPAGQ